MHINELTLKDLLYIEDITLKKYTRLVALTEEEIDRDQKQELEKLHFKLRAINERIEYIINNIRYD
jgi:hypothetical protein